MSRAFPREARIVPPQSKMTISSRGKANPTVAEMIKMIGDQKQPGLTAAATDDPLKIDVGYDSDDDLTVVQRLIAGTTWIFQ